MFSLSRRLLDETFAVLRQCGEGRRECQVFWTSSFSSPGTLSQVVHPRHSSSANHVKVEDSWITEFWKRLAAEQMSVRVQVHTHRTSAFHSPTDDKWPLVHVPGFLSLVLPRFAFGPAGFEGAFLAEIGSDGKWHRVAVGERIDLS